MSFGAFALLLVCCKLAGVLAWLFLQLWSSTLEELFWSEDDR